MLLHFESEEEYESHIADIVGALRPVGAAETNVAAEYADIMWVRRRWLIAFANHLQEQAEAAVAKDPANANATDCANALTAIDGLLGILQHAVGAGIISQREMIVAPAKLVFGLIVQAGAAPLDEQERLHVAIEQLRKANRKNARLDALTELLNTAIVVREHVERAAKTSTERLERARSLLLETATPTARKGRELERYRRLIDNNATSLLETIEKLRSFRHKADGAGSSVAPGLNEAPAAELRLRVVR